MRSGQLRHRITVQQYTETRDDFGAVVETWADFAANVPAFVKPVASSDKWTGQQTTQQITHEIKMRYLSGVKSEMRVLYGSRVFDISAPPINWQERNMELTLLCTERL